MSEMEIFLNYSSEFNLKIPCLTMHIQHGDIPTRKNFNLSHHVKKAEFLLDMIGTKNIFLIFNDALVEEDIKDFPELQFSYVPRTRRKGNSPVNKMFEGDPDTEMYWILILLKMASYCSGFVGTFSSNFSALIYQSMCLLNGGHCPVFESLDDPDWHVLY